MYYKRKLIKKKILIKIGKDLKETKDLSEKKSPLYNRNKRSRT